MLPADSDSDSNLAGNNRLDLYICSQQRYNVSTYQAHPFCQTNLTPIRDNLSPSKQARENDAMHVALPLGAGLVAVLQLENCCVRPTSAPCAPAHALESTSLQTSVRAQSGRLMG